MMQTVVNRGVRFGVELTISFLVLSLTFGLLSFLGLALIVGLLRTFSAS